MKSPDPRTSIAIIYMIVAIIFGLLTIYHIIGTIIGVCMVVILITDSTILLYERIKHPVIPMEDDLDEIQQRFMEEISENS